ncbi:MAG: ArsB/NhaD family transporter [Candidatus Marinimicrobia bacterium]|jgi:Na+/H+ antiporter NhaD/arsenite permease-like protein|nr:ArsB/NhaD family transporter [Candidatus Neomarinimicrobiota bacterium]MBT3617458.1 ArsB/NhaD family transporter [Candidatus Neomarinimicrobiota bacterium]MBT3829398.1 ArsB/NhaD family transporter [Candidatus Neomarinimicrobiota bacterium]MBT3997681.1 ArsB/NhaD family transporter [Candidatus Neomarinimicrobiota bacterium]MBT4280979.1 ArsB/NhaD family transporter [Candidatus Neomarinimicrobiota bacterium]
MDILVEFKLVLIPIVVFLVVYAAITFELVNKAVAAMSGVSVLVLLHVVGEHQAVELIDMETIMLLTGMMIIVSILRLSGFFTIVSVKIAEVTQGSPTRILVLFSIVTALMSAFLDNVTTVLIIIPIIIELTRGMGLDPKKYVLSQALISNIGGTATLIGDPPNIIIGSKVGLTFNQFMFNLAPLVVIVFIIILFALWISNRDEYKPINTNLTKLLTVQLLMEKIRFEFMNIRIDRSMMHKGLMCLFLAIALFMTQTITKLAPGVVALSVAMLLFIISKADVEYVLEEVEWSTLMFFAGLFILVGVLEETGVIEWIAHHVFVKVGDNPYIAVLMVLWVSGIISGFLDNIPFTITMIPIIHLMLETNPIPNNILWWALAFGACFGGNITMIGSSANIVSIGIAKKHGVNISFMDFMKTGAWVTFISLSLASIYLTFFLWMSL